MLRVVLAALLLVDGVGVALRVAHSASFLDVYDATTAALVAARFGVGALDLVAVWLVLARRPPAVAIARAALLGSAALTTIEEGFGLAPTLITPTQEWTISAAAWIYALSWTWWLSRERTDPS